LLFRHQARAGEYGAIDSVSLPIWTHETLIALRFDTVARFGKSHCAPGRSCLGPSNPCPDRCPPTRSPANERLRFRNPWHRLLLL